jgi:nicotinate phosphoribosyltransferase
MEKLLNWQDQYKFPMGQLIYEQEPDTEVTFKMTNRKAKKGMRIADYVQPEELQAYYDGFRDTTFTPDQIAILEQQTDKRYTKEFLGYLAAFRLPEIEVSIDPATNDITAETTAPWNAASLWEIPMLSAIAELYYPRYIQAHGGTMEQVWAEGDRRLDAMIALMKENPDVKFAEFGTRRRFSSEWQDHAVGRFVEECPENLIGTSNPWLAAKYNIPASGTNAHELSMTYATLMESRGGNPIDGQIKVVEDWLERFPSMPVVLTDTFTTEATLASLTDEQIEQIKSYRIDSGDEYAVGEKIITFLRMNDIDPLTRTLFFSNSLTPEKAVALHRYFTGKVGVAFGIGGHSVNNMGLDDTHDLPSMNIVAKAVNVNGNGTVKLSDDEGKHMGNPRDIARYKWFVAERVGKSALALVP